MSGTEQSEIVTRQNKHGVEKQYVRVPVGTKVIEVPRRYRNPLTDRTHDLTKLSDDGYLKPFLALNYAISQDTIDLSSSPVLSFDKSRWELDETDDHHILVKRESESEFDEQVLDGGRSLRAETEGSQ